jgi:hypothetical protein
MQATEFTTTVQNGIVQVPAPENLPEGTAVRILVLFEHPEPDVNGNTEATFEAWDALLSAVPDPKER